MGLGTRVQGRDSIMAAQTGIHGSKAIDRRKAPTRIMALAVAAWITASPLAAQQGGSDDPYLLTQSGIASLGAQRYDAALSYFDEALLLNPGYLDAEAGKARALAGLGQFTDAMAITSRLSKLDPKYKLDDATILLLVKKPERALQQVDSAAKVIQGDQELSLAMSQNQEFYRRAHYLRAEAYYMMRGYDRAGGDFQIARKLGAGSPALRGIGDTYVALDDLSSAEAAYTKALQHRRHDGLAYHRRARVRYLRGNLEGALADFKEAEVYVGNGQEFLSQYAEALSAAGNHAAAVTVLNRLLRVAREDRQNPDYQRVVRYHLAVELIDAGRPRDAEIELSALDGWSEIAVERAFQRGRARFALRDFPGSIRFFNDALALRRGDSDILYNRGIAWLRMDEVEKALNDLSEAAVRDGGNARIRDAIGRIRLSRGEYKEALAFYDAAVKAHPSEILPLIQRANAYLATGNAEGALEDAEKALRIDRQNMEATTAAANALLALDRPDEAQDYADQLVRSVSRKKSGYLLSARADLAQENPSDALANIEQARNHGADPARLAILAGDAHYLAQDYTKALAEYQRGVRLTGNATYAVVRRGDAHMELGQHDAATRDYSAILQNYPEDYDLLIKRGKALKRAGNCIDATKDFNRALVIIPDDNTAIGERARCNISSGRLFSGFSDFFRSLI